MGIELEPTGERMILEQYQETEEAQLVRLFHVVTYRFAEKYTAGKHILDYGCGSGYGSAMIAASAASVVAVDVAADAIAYARAHHARTNVEFGVIDPDKPLPFDAGRFETVLSFQVIEHVREPAAYLREVVRVLKPGGVLVMATPDRRTRLLPLQRPWNRYHLTEYSERSFSALLAPHFAELELFTMGGEPSVLEVELRRARKLKWGTLPFTLPIMPDRLRVEALGAIRSLKRKLLASKLQQSTPRKATFAEADVSIGKDLWPSVNLIAVARRR